MGTGAVTLTPLADVPFVREGDDVARLVGDAIDAADIAPIDSDVVVVTQKIVSRAEGRHVRPGSRRPSTRTRAWWRWCSENRTTSSPTATAC